MNINMEHNTELQCTAAD